MKKLTRLEIKIDDKTICFFPLKKIIIKIQGNTLKIQLKN